jgi:hypothetical protein
LFTGFTLGAGFKGGEVTPLFIGATLGSALSTFVPLPLRFWQEWDLWPFFWSYSYAYRLHSHGNRTLWNRKWTICRTCLFYSLFGIGANRYLPFPNCKGPKHLLYQKLKEGN